MNAQYMLDIRTALEKIGKLDSQIIDVIAAVSARYDIRHNDVPLTNQSKEEEQRLINEYIRVRRGEGLSEKTLKLYGNRVRDFVEWSSKPLDQLKKIDMQEYLQQYEATHTVSRRTMETYRIAVYCFFEWLTEQEIITKNPMSGIRKIKYEKKPRKALTSDQMAQLKGSCKDSKQLAIIETMYSTGCRIAELACLKLEDVDLTSGVVHLFGKGGKYRDSYLSPDAKYAIKQYLAERNDHCEYLISSERGGHGVTTDQMRRYVKAIADRCDLGWVTPHILRHTFATRMLRSNVPITDIQHIMGHSSANTTMIYAEVSEDNVKNGHIRCFG